MDEIGNELGWSKEQLRAAVDYAVQTGLATYAAMGGWMAITVNGIDFAEGPVDQDVDEGIVAIKRNGPSRTGRTMTEDEPLDRPTAADFDRAMKQLVHDRLEEMLRSRLEVQHQFIAAGGLAHSRYPVTTADKYDAIYRAFLVDALDRAVPYVGRVGPPKQVAVLLRPHLEGLRDKALSEIPDAMQMKAALESRYRVAFTDRLEAALRDLETGMVNGKVINMTSTQGGAGPSLSSEPFVAPARIDALRSIRSTEFDLSKLIRICEELNSNWSNKNWFSVAALIRMLLDHVPPVFGAKNFDTVVAQGGGKSFKELMGALNVMARNTADLHLHDPIKKKQVLPTSVQVDQRTAVDHLLVSIIERLA